MTTEISCDSQDGVFAVGAANGSTDYVMWQRTDGSIDASEIHFEWNDQSNGGYHLVSECAMDRDGIHLVLSDDQLVHFYFRELTKEQWDRFRDGLERMYLDSARVIEFNY